MLIASSKIIAYSERLNGVHAIHVEKAWDKLIRKRKVRFVSEALKIIGAGAFGAACSGLPFVLGEAGKVDEAIIFIVMGFAGLLMGFIGIVIGRD